MARSPLKARALYREMRHAIGGPLSKELREQDLLNDALDQFTSMHSWTFLENGEVYIDIRGSVTLSDWTWTAATLTLSDPLTGGLLAGYTRQPGDLVIISGGGTSVAGYYAIASNTDDALVLETSISATDTTLVDGATQPRSAILPADFLELIEAGFDTDTSIIADIVIASSTTVSRYQRQVLPSLNRYYACAERAIDSDGSTINLLRLAPVATTNNVSAILCVYKRHVPAIETDGDNVLVPWYAQRLLKNICRAMARGLEMPGTYGDFDDQLGKILEGPVFELAKEQDDAIQIEIGHIKNGHVPKRGSVLDGSYLATNISIGGPVTP